MQFSSDLDEETRERLRHGERIVEIFKQPQFKPLPLEYEIIVLFAVQKGCFAEIKIEDMLDFESKLIDQLNTWNSDIVDEIRRENEISADLEKRLLEAINQFKSTYLTT
jgi:F-type H+-transporting ATPase subunit alpha